MASEVEKNGFGELAAVYSVIVAEILAGHGRFVNVQHLLSVVGSSFEDVGAVGQKVVQRGKHLCINDNTEYALCDARHNAHRPKSRWHPT